MTKNALVVEDDLSMARALEWLLASLDISATLVSSGQEAIACLQSTTYDLVLLDMTLDDMDGLDILKAVPDGIDARILVLSGDDSALRKTAALTSGARDYVVKPFDHAELCARIKLVMRKNSAISPVQLTGPIQVDLANHIVKVNGEFLQLTRTEQQILELFSENKGKVIPKKEIMIRLYDDEWKSMSESMIGVYVFKIRQKIAMLGGPADGCIQALKGRGYVFRDPVPLAMDNSFATAPAVYQSLS